MRAPTRLFITALVPLLSGCATLRATVDGWSGGRDGLSRPQRELREALAGGDFATALAFRDDDALLRALTSGATTYYAAQFTRSAALLDTAALLADDRLTASISKNALSLVTNDMARPYQPRRTERLFVPYYGMLSYAQLGQWEDAAVEARRMVALLAQYAGDRDDDERALHAGMHYLAGAVFECAGERNAASVAYRNAHALVSAYPEQPVVSGAREGEVLVIVERGFVAHRATETIRLAIGGDDRDDRDGHERPPRLSVPLDAAPTSGPASQSASGVAVAAVITAAGAKPSDNRHARRNGDDDDDDDDDGIHRVSVSFPSLRRSPRPWAGAPRILEESSLVAPRAGTFSVAWNVDDASAVDERRERAGMIAREMARATAKYAVTKAVRDKSGKVAGAIAEVGAAFLERADVRSWHLLPQEVVLLRLRLPAGQHALVVEVGEGANRRTVALGMVTVKPGVVVLAPARVWREPAAEPARDRRGRCDRMASFCGL